MQASDVIRIVRGPATARFRGDTLHLRPLFLALLVWTPLAATRALQGPLQADMAAMGLTLPLALLPLCIKARSGEPRPAPRLVPALARMALLLVAAMTAHGVWLWLAPEHD